MFLVSSIVHEFGHGFVARYIYKYKVSYEIIWHWKLPNLATVIHGRLEGIKRMVITFAGGFAQIIFILPFGYLMTSGLLFAGYQLCLIVTFFYLIFEMVYQYRK